MQTRREFIKDTCATCLSASVLGMVFAPLASCSSLPVYKTDLMKASVDVPLSSFAESNLVLVRDMQVPYDILLVKKSADEYSAIYMKCSHRENPVSATRTGLYCSEHGSTFDFDGNVTKEPALEPLKKFKTTINENSVTIEVKS